jgi:hypothetical protein
MGKMRSLFLGATIIASSFALTGAHATCPSGSDSNKSTAGGSKKDCTGDIHCGENGQIVAIPGADGTAIHILANPDASTGPEVEACNGTGTGTTQGRAVVRVNTADPGVRGSLDTDDETPQFPGGYINVQVGQKGTGVWCNQQNEAPSQAGHNIDAYEQPWGTPGSDGGLGPDAVHCVPTQ